MIRCIHRTNIYLDEDQAAALDDSARAQGISRAALIRRLIDRGLGRHDADLESDLSAIHDSFGVLAGHEELMPRGSDERSRRLETRFER